MCRHAYALAMCKFRGTFEAESSSNSDYIRLLFFKNMTISLRSHLPRMFHLESIVRNFPHSLKYILQWVGLDVDLCSSSSGE